MHYLQDDNIMDLDVCLVMSLEFFFVDNVSYLAKEDLISYQVRLILL